MLTTVQPPASRCGLHLLGALVVGELSLGIVVVDQQREPGDLQHLGVAVSVPAGEQRLAPVRFQMCTGLPEPSAMGISSPFVR